MEDVFNGEPVNIRSEIYHFLAEALSEPPEWLNHAGPAWPLYELASRASGQSGAARDCLLAFEKVPAGDTTDRKKRYRRMITGDGRRIPIAMYESLFRHGQIAGPEMFAVERTYSENGLQTQSSELPDHASLELAFLARLVELDSTAGSRRTRERAFIKAHAGQWMRAIGREMAASGDVVYAPIGRFLESWLYEAEHWQPQRNVKRVPVVADPADCILCGFCAQVCPTGALMVRESYEYTGLVTTASACTGCGKCVLHCETGALSISPSGWISTGETGKAILVESPREHCSHCEAPTISSAEFQYMVGVLGRQPWLSLCLDCRTRKEVNE